MNDPFVKAKRDLRRSDTELHRYEALILKLQDALGTEESGDALVEVAKNAKHGELAYLVSQREPKEQRSIDITTLDVANSRFLVTIRGVGGLAFNRQEAETLAHLLTNELVGDPEAVMRTVIQEVAELPLPTGFGEQDQLLTVMIEKAREWLRVAKVTT